MRRGWKRRGEQKGKKKDEEESSCLCKLNYFGGLF